MKRMLLVILILAALAISGCTENQDKPEKSVEDLKALSLSAADNLTSYSLKSTISNIRTLNERGENATAENATIIKESAETTAIVNLAGKQAHARGSTTIEVEHRGSERNTTTNEADLYQMGNSTYIRDNGNWTHLQDPMTAEEIWKDGRNNQIKAMAETFNLSQAELAGSENINGTDAYKLRIINGAAESDSLYETAFSMAANLVSYPMFMPSVNRTELNETGRMEKTIWISKNTYIPVKYESKTSFKMTPIIVAGLDMNTSQMTMFNESIELGTVEVSMESSDMYYDFDKPGTIAPPTEALEAVIVRPVSIQPEGSLPAE
jgi:hypothetical protein